MVVKIKEMPMDKNIFFREAMLLLLGKPRIETAMQDCLVYLKKYMPADRLALNIYDRSLKAIRVMAFATPQEALRPNTIYPLDKASQKDMESPDRPKNEKFNRLTQDPISGSLARKSGLFVNHSLLVVDLRPRKDLAGSLVLFAKKEDQYTDQHLNLFAMLKELFENILANVIRYDELNQVKELLYKDLDDLRRKLHRIPGGEVVGKDFGLKQVMELVTEVAPLGSPVLLLGETGVGKEVIANAIHNLSPRKGSPFFPVNCGAIPEGLIDSELFGHERGAFTGATLQKKGHFELAHKGTIFLDEVGELPPQAQVRMLRVLQEKEVQRVGGSARIHVDVRIIAASHQNLQEMIQDGHFRSDLWFRLHVFPIVIPPLRNRKEDIPALVTHFIEKKRRELNLPAPNELVPDTLETLVNYDWPGNVRELENVVERALILCKGRALRFNELIPKDDIKGKIEIQNPAQRFSSLDDFTAHYIRQILKETRGKIEGHGGAAEILKVKPGTLRHRMKKLKIPFRKKETLDAWH